MIRSLYSGVAGMKSQQTKMDVIGNNIANVGTYGYKSDRATFQDVYYQTTSAATQATGNIGGTNAKQVGYGNSVSSIDTNTATSAMTATGYSLDVAIAGEGFLQVMGADGNIMYTKAGMLDIDADGNLVDVNGYFVLGVSGDATKAGPSSEKINIALPYLDPDNAKVTEKVNNVSYDITVSNMTTKGNVNFSFSSSSALPVGVKMVAEVSGSSINIKLNSKEYFKSMDDFNSYLNQAITDALGGEQHPAGIFTITSSDESMFNAPLSPLDPTAQVPTAMGLTGAEIVGNNFGYKLGEAGYIKNGPDLDKANVLKNLFSVSTVNSGFQGDTRILAATPGSKMEDGNADDPAGMNISFDEKGLTITVTSNGSVNDVTHLGAGEAVYVGTVSYDKINAPGEVILRRINLDAVSDDAIKAAQDALTAAQNATPLDQAAVDAAQAKVDMLKPISDAKNAYETAQTALTSAQTALTAAQAALTQAQQAGADITAAQDALDKAQADLEKAIKDVADLKLAYDNSRMKVAKDNNLYSNDETDSFVMNYPEYTSIKNSFQQINAAVPGSVSGDFDAIDSLRKGAATGTVSLNAGNILNLKSTEPSKDLGLGQKAFTLKGGTAGGEQTVANLTAISVGQDGVIVGVHDIWGVMELGRIDLATFANPAGLTKVGSTYFDESLNSGSPIVVNAGTEGTGNIMASTLESSNVDLSSEFTDMIVTQRGFQASSRVITVSDSMLEELINLKR